MRSIYDFSAKNLFGEAVSLETYKGKVLLIVNTASKCGFTPQYHELEKIYRRFKDLGVVVLGFPCNQFAQQEPSTSTEIQAFCETNYDITFPLFEKINVNGEHSHPLYQYLKQQVPGILGSKAIKWNFTKFLIRKDGTVFGRYAPITKPEKLVADIQQLLAE